MLTTDEKLHSIHSKEYLKEKTIDSITKILQTDIHIYRTHEGENSGVQFDDIQIPEEALNKNIIKRDVEEINKQPETKTFLLPRHNNDYVLISIPKEKECLEFYMDDAFIGGSCIKVNPSDELSKDHRTIRLFHSKFYVEESVIACVVTKKLKGNFLQDLNIILEVVNADGVKGRIVLFGDRGSVFQSESNDINIRPLNENMVEFKELQRYMLLTEPSFYVPVGNFCGWRIR